MTIKEITEEYSECRANTLYLVLPTGSTDKNHIPAFTEIQRYRKIKQNMKDAKNLLQISDVFYASMYNIEITDSSLYIRETS